MKTQMNKTILDAAQAPSIYSAAQLYTVLGFSILPLKGKRPALSDWKQYQTKPAHLMTIRSWWEHGLLENIGLVCGAVSNNHVALDLDGAEGYPAFVKTFPHLAETYTIATGGGVGKHIYWQVETLPPPVKAMKSPIGNLEMCAEGRQIVVPPSVHPITKNHYKVEKAVPVLQVADLQDVVDWIESFKKNAAPVRQWQPPKEVPLFTGDLNPRLLEEISHYFARQGYHAYGEWLHGQCLYPHRHKNGDRHPSFGFNTRSGYGHCFSCGTILAKDICSEAGIRPEDYGGLMERLPNAPQSNQPKTPLPVPQKVEVVHSSKSEESKPSSDLPPLQLQEQDLANIPLPTWLQQYLDWAGKTGNQTPMNFHLAAGLWLLAVAVGRRLYGESPWGLSIYPNLYLMLIASTTYYRKSTAYKLAEQIARAAIPHMLMPTPGSPERFQESLSGKLPQNFKDLTESQQQRLKLAQPFAAQRGLLKDEVAGLFGAMNRKDYMSGMKDLLMELYDCPDYSDKDTQMGLTIVENAALSILGVTTPDGLNSSISQADWANGLLIRFALITPEVNYRERPAQVGATPPPTALIEGLKRLHEKLPLPQSSETGLLPPEKLALRVECWEACQDYSQQLRQYCKPNQELELDERLKGVYGRMHVQAFKLASLFAALDWIDSEAPQPTVTLQNWASGKAITDAWLGSAHRLVERLDHNHESQREQTVQRRIQEAFYRVGPQGEKLHTVYKNLHLSARQARQATEELVRAGILVLVRQGRAEAYVHQHYIKE